MNQNKSFLDRGTLTALVVVMGFWIFWSRYMDSKYPQQQNTGTQQEVVQDNKADRDLKELRDSIEVQKMNNRMQEAMNEKVLDFSDANMSFVLTSKGMGVEKIDIKNYTTRENEPIILSRVDNQPSFASVSLSTNLPIDFKIERVNQNEFLGHAVEGNQQIE